MIPKGLCQCGCGERTNIVQESNKNIGYVRGEPFRYILGHNSKTGIRTGKRWKFRNYAVVYLPEHERAHVSGRIYEHILMAEKAIGKPLPTYAQIHHFPDASDFTHLVICQDDGYHKLLHLRYRALKEGGHANWRKCKFCKKWDAPENLYIHKANVYHKYCHADYNKKRYHLKKLAQKASP